MELKEEQKKIAEEIGLTATKLNGLFKRAIESGLDVYYEDSFGDIVKINVTVILALISLKGTPRI